MRMIELMGGQTGPNGQTLSTDAAQRWRSELQSQQDVQNERLRQEQMQMLGVGTDPNDPSHTIQTLGARAQSETEAARQFQNQMQYTEQMGYQINPLTGQTGGPTLARERMEQEMAAQAQQRALQERMQGTQYTHEGAMQQALFGQQTSLQSPAQFRNRVTKSASCWRAAW
jgi:hypothetical protein